MVTPAQLDALGTLLALAWHEADELQREHPDGAHQTHTHTLELAAFVVHKLAARLDCERCA